ncbi:UV radiation resistance protein and autophagy-related subunit 14-domain-containing protein [Hygrophoropsis aurantiaca]|uniref:UV radiation resistance protein and autophagy-related subunit 14-domain-containing protein n=1 Tax=Hygrophoropsis aurantiaca TaxID=72124 RepID=A0ACB8AHM3_9AGAM|nr:UV radiation resistance protein and autophagy-related subunit 14-domain-containing protein [Hygrophoropsis aurantiaca]
MECKICELRQRQFYCENCLKTHLRDFRLQTQRCASDRDEHVAKSTRALRTIEPARSSRAVVANVQGRVDELAEGLARLRKDNDTKRTRLRMLKESLASRRRTLSAAKLLPATPLEQSTAKETQELVSLSNTIARARSGLVQELIEVFNIVEVGGRPPIGGKAGTKGEWTIGDLILPVPGDIRRYPPDHINAVITHTIHFLGLLTFYLGVKLPFEIHWSAKRLGVGQPWIGASKGTEAGGWAKWTTKHPLHLSASTSSSSSSPTSPTTALPPPILPSESYYEPYADADADADPTTSPTTVPTTSSKSKSSSTSATRNTTTASFTTAFAMLLYNVCYLAHTQSVDVPLSQAGDALSNLWAVCCSPELGRRSHRTTPLLPPPTPATFSLDFAQLLQATTANPSSRARGTGGIRGRGALIARESSLRMQGNSPVRPRHGNGRISEEDEGWDLIEDVDGLG